MERGTKKVAIIEFPPHSAATEQGLLALGGDLEIPSLILAYSQGIFPWPISEEFPLAWFSPNPRGILFYSDLHLSKQLKKIISRHNYSISIDKNFPTVINRCAEQIRGKNHQGTWITKEVIESYIDFHKAGFAHSVEVNNEEGQLIGGLYGVYFQGVFSGESMYFETPNASKIALIETMNFLESVGIHWIDTQMVSPVVRSLGGKEIPREDFLSHLKYAQKTWNGSDPFQEFNKKGLSFERPMVFPK